MFVYLVYLFKGPTVVNLKDDFYYFSMSQNQKLTGEYIRGCYDRQMVINFSLLSSQYKLLLNVIQLLTFFQLFYQNVLSPQ